MNQPAKVCDEIAFRTLHKLCARLTRKMPYALYLAVWHTQDAQAEKKLPRLLTHGEVCCNMQPGIWYILLFAQSEAEAEAHTAALARQPGSALRLQRVTQRLVQDPTFDD